VTSPHDAILEYEWSRREVMHVDLQGKKVIAIGERDGVQATAIAAVARSAGALVLLELNQCFV
jgi:glycine reductase